MCPDTVDCFKRCDSSYDTKTTLSNALEQFTNLLRRSDLLGLESA